MKRAVALIVVALSALTVARVADAASLCVGPQGGCFAQIQPAIAAANDGDTITVASGTYAGGVTIDKSVRIQGAGADKTVIKGGGPVVTISRATDPTGLSVLIDGVTITGGVNNIAPDTAVTFGGGVAIPVAQLDQPPFNGTGATVSISNSVVTGNTVTSNDVIPPGFCGPVSCGFNDGGGIDNGGVLTLTNTRVTNNTAGSTSGLASAASDAGSGGIDNRFPATLVMRNSVVSGNRAVVDSPIANESSGGGIGSVGGLDIADSAVTNNTVAYTGSREDGDQAAFAGGIVIDQCCDTLHPTASVRNTLVTGNQVVVNNTNPDAGPTGYGGGIVAFAPASLDRVSLTGNSVQVTGAGFASGDGGGMEVDAPVTMSNSLVAHNSVTVRGPLGALAGGGGVQMYGADLTLIRTTVLANIVSGSGAAAPLPFGGVSSVLGGGISNGGFGVTPATLTVTDSLIAGNRLSASTGFVVRGGGIYTEAPIASTHTIVFGNQPDNCFGC